MRKEVLGKVFPAGQTIVKQGDAGDCMYVIQEGDAEVFKVEGAVETLVDHMHAGDIFGEMAILERQKRSATVRARTDVRVLTIDKKTFLRRVQEDPSLAFTVLRSMSNRVRRLDIELAELKSEIEL